MIVRPSTEADLAACQAIYAHHVLHGKGTFEEVPPDLTEMTRRRTDVLTKGGPHLVAEIDGAVAGFAYAGPFRLRSAYRFTAEDSVYIADDMRGRGVGKALLTEVIKACDRLGIHQVIAVIGDSENAGSIGVHRSCGFEMIGTMPGMGFKHGRFVDVVLMQLSLNGGAGSEPKGQGLAL
jgi:L-amino acid N-acyltransferase YncA